MSLVQPEQISGDSKETNTTENLQLTDTSISVPSLVVRCSSPGAQLEPFSADVGDLDFSLDSQKNFTEFQLNSSIDSDESEKNSFYSLNTSFSVDESQKCKLSDSDVSLASSYHSSGTLRSHSFIFTPACDSFRNTSPEISAEEVDSEVTLLKYSAIDRDSQLDNSDKMNSTSDIQDPKLQNEKIEKNDSDKPKKSLISSFRKRRKSGSKVKRTKSDLSHFAFESGSEIGSVRDIKSDEESPASAFSSEPSITSAQHKSDDSGFVAEVSPGTKHKKSGKSKDKSTVKKEYSMKRSLFRKKDSPRGPMSSDQSDAADTDNSLVDFEGTDDNESGPSSLQNLPRAETDEAINSVTPVLTPELTSGTQENSGDNNKSTDGKENSIPETKLRGELSRQLNANKKKTTMGLPIRGPNYSDIRSRYERPVVDDSDVVLVNVPDSVKPRKPTIENEVNKPKFSYPNFYVGVANEKNVSGTRMSSPNRLSPILLRKFSSSASPEPTASTSDKSGHSSPSSGRYSRPVTPITSNEPPLPNHPSSKENQRCRSPNYPLSVSSALSSPPGSLEYYCGSVSPDSLELGSTSPGVRMKRDGNSRSKTFKPLSTLGISFEDIDFKVPMRERKLSSSAGSSNGDKNEHLYKILVIGELGTGKTSIIKRYVHQFFSQHYRATIGVDFALKVLNWDSNTVIRLQLWDIAGQERFGNMTRVYYKEAVGAFIVFDVSRSQTFDCVNKWKADLDSKVTLPNGSSIPTVLLANKCDQPKEGLASNPTKMDDYCKENGYAGWFETSAKENINIDEAAKFLVSNILTNEQNGLMITDSLDRDKLTLDWMGKEDKESSSASCKC